ncbi:hypothetical protein APY03_6104 [Variovorax sp. WDL1]|nr:hypothetical protein APY03_6104 [Variovorax sp. WDL1]
MPTKFKSRSRNIPAILMQTEGRLIQRKAFLSLRLHSQG